MLENPNPTHNNNEKIVVVMTILLLSVLSGLFTGSPRILDSNRINTILENLDFFYDNKLMFVFIFQA